MKLEYPLTIFFNNCPEKISSQVLTEYINEIYDKTSHLVFKHITFTYMSTFTFRSNYTAKDFLWDNNKDTSKKFMVFTK